MPVMDGLETTRQIRKLAGNKIPIVILTAYDWEEIAEEAKKVGVNAFLAKPLFRSKLYNVMLELISDRQQLEQSQATSLLGDNAAFSGQILLVEDNELNMEIAIEFFGICGASVEKAWNQPGRSDSWNSSRGASILPLLPCRPMLLTKM